MAENQTNVVDRFIVSIVRPAGSHRVNSAELGFIITSARSIPKGQSAMTSDLVDTTIAPEPQLVRLSDRIARRLMVDRGHVHSRESVYEIVESELDYQTEMGARNQWGEGEGAHSHSVGDFVLMLTEYTARARSAWHAHQGGNESAMDVVRKVAGIAFAAMLRHGAPMRVIPPDTRPIPPGTTFAADEDREGARGSLLNQS